MAPRFQISPLPGSFPFEPKEITLHTKGVPFVAGFVSRTKQGSDDPTDAADELVFDVVEADSLKLHEMALPLAVLWHTRGYKVFIVSCKHSKAFFQRATLGREWCGIKRGWAFDLADPVRTIVDRSVHIKLEYKSAQYVPLRKKVRWAFKTSAGAGTTTENDRLANSDSDATGSTSWRSRFRSASKRGESDQAQSTGTSVRYQPVHTSIRRRFRSAVSGREVDTATAANAVDAVATEPSQPAETAIKKKRRSAIKGSQDDPDDGAVAFDAAANQRFKPILAKITVLWG